MYIFHKIKKLDLIITNEQSINWVLHGLKMYSINTLYLVRTKDINY